MRARETRGMVRRAAFAGIVTLVVVSAARSAWADIVSQPPTDCPPGTVGSNVCQPHCEVLACAADGDCAQGMTCQAVSMCMADIKCERGNGPPLRAALPTWGRSSVCDQGALEQVTVCIARGAVEPGTLAAAGTRQQTHVSPRGLSASQVGATVLLLVSLGAIVVIRRRQSAST